MNADSKKYRSVCIGLLSIAICSVGCTQSIQWKTPKIFSLDSTWPFRDKDAPHKGTPVRIVSTWSDTVLTQPGQKAQRGFGGRLMFYDKEGQKPILVDGQLVVYAFDENGRNPTDNKPTRRYVFPADQIPLHMSKSEVGASYSFWLPWDDVGGPRTEVSLICRFEPKEGGVVTSEQTRELLPGPSRPAVAKAGPHEPPKVPEGVPMRPARQTLESLQNSRTAEQNARLISYEAPAVAANPQIPNPQMAAIGTPQVAAMPARMTSTTIALPPNYQLPNVAELNAAAQAAHYPQVVAQVPQQPNPNIAQWQAPTAANRSYVGTMPTGVPMSAAQPVGVNQTYVGQTYAGVQQQQPALLNTPPAVFPGPPQTVQLPQYPQPVVEQMLPQRVSMVQQSWPQMAQQMPQTPVQAVPGTTVTYPALGQVPR